MLLLFYWKMCDIVIPESCTLPIQSPPSLVALFHQLLLISGRKVSVSAAQKPHSDGKICKADSHLKDSSHAHSVQGKAG